VPQLATVDEVHLVTTQSVHALDFEGVAAHAMQADDPLLMVSALKQL
jgi:hypothetical protein